MRATSAFGWWVRTVLMSRSTAPEGWAREKRRGSSVRSEAVFCVVSVMRTPPAASLGFALSGFGGVRRERSAGRGPGRHAADHVDGVEAVLAQEAGGPQRAAARVADHEKALV